MLGCTPEPATLVVDLRTDFVPNVELIGVRVSPETGAPRDHVVDADRDYTTGVRVAELEGIERGQGVRLTIEAVLRDGEPVRQPVIAQIEASLSSITVVLSRSCADRACNPDQACVFGQCADAACLPEQPQSCPAVECSVATDCAVLSACAEARCAEGTCLYDLIPDGCGDGEYCAPEAGCVPDPTFAGPTCSDGERNGDESDVDCGGSCAPCVAGRACAGNADCDQGSCLAGACACAWGPFENVTRLEVSSDRRDYLPRTSRDGLTLYFASYQAGGAGESDLWRATRSDVGQPFGPAENLSTLNTMTGDSAPFPTADGLTLLFTQWMTAAFNDERLEFATRSSTDDAFVIASGPLLAELEAPGSSTAAPALSFDELELVFGTDRAPTQGQHDLWHATRAATDQPFDAPTPLTELASPGMDHWPTLSADGLVIYFSSDRSGDYEIYRARRDAPGSPFGPPEPVDELNTDVLDGDPFLTPDGTTMYFISSRVGSTGPPDLYVATRGCR